MHLEKLDNHDNRTLPYSWTLHTYLLCGPRHPLKYWSQPCLYQTAYISGFKTIPLISKHAKCVQFVLMDEWRHALWWVHVEHVEDPAEKNYQTITRRVQEEFRLSEIYLTFDIDMMTSRKAVFNNQESFMTPDDMRENAPQISRNYICCGLDALGKGD